jgi:alpha/beta superfamily hydrolase
LTKVRVQTGEVIERQTIEGANHFYQHHLEEMEQACETYLIRRLEEAEQKLRKEAEEE